MTDASARSAAHQVAGRDQHTLTPFAASVKQSVPALRTGSFMSFSRRDTPLLSDPSSDLV